MESAPTGVQPGCAGSGPMASIGTLQIYSKERLRENPTNIFSFCKNRLDRAKPVCYTK